MTQPAEVARQAPWLQVEDWTAFPGLVHGFSRRLCDREASLTALNASDLTLHTFKQVHGNDIETIIHPVPHHDRPEADGAITTTPGVLIGIATADCVPLLMIAPSRRLVAAVHAGWRGTLQGIARTAVQKLVATWQVPPSDIQVALGPSIGGCCYEVGPEVGETIVQRWRITDPAAWRPIGNKGFLDLRAANTFQLADLGVPCEQIRKIGPCTFCDSGFSSYRREGAQTGRQLSVVGWQER